MKRRILIVDDEACIRESLQIYLSEQGHDVQTAESPQYCSGGDGRGCRQASACADVLLIDQWMPGMTGIDYLEQRREWHCRSVGQHIALMSASLSDDVRSRATRLGSKLFQKPLRFDELEQWLATLAR